MLHDDPFADVSPWDEPTTSAENTNPTEEKPVTSANPAPFKLGITLKAASSFEAEWITGSVHGGTADETAKRYVELVRALKGHGAIELTAQAAQYTRDQYKGGPGSTPKRFENGKVVASNTGSGDYTCDHGQRVFKDNGPDSWAVYFCAGRHLPKPQQCPPLWRQKDGTFRAK
ncbi:hypothetical protein AB0L75_34665 [Streptomyces sp. NPDC052101]|uniref:hypothetical protein n=1 Tax=Streptomyces sp. NPDC052101 TaxID=3155763 RepID=UPI00344A645E